MSKPVATLPRLGGVLFLLRALATARRNGKHALDASPAHYFSPALNPLHLARYRTALGFSASGVPLTYLYLLAQRAQLGLMLAPTFPHAVAGMVHVANRLSWSHRGVEGLDMTLPFDIEVRAVPEPSSPSGAQFLSFEVGMTQAGREVAVCSSRYLARRGHRSADEKRTHTPPERIGARIDNYGLEADAGRRYAALSGDINPIHLWPWSARLLGFKRPIIHGMHTVGKMAAALETTQRQPLRSLAVKFLKPAALPSEVALCAQGTRVQAWCGPVLIVEGQVGF